MNIRKTEKTDITAVMNIFDISRNYMRKTGNLNQWTNGYPQKEILENDIMSEKSFVCCDDNKIIATFFFSTEGDPTYNKIYEGQWLNNLQYGVIHRIGVASQNRGIASFCLDWCFAKIQNIRIDTHRDNIPMQNLLKKHCYKYCGIIYLESGDERVAFQKN